MHTELCLTMLSQIHHYFPPSFCYFIVSSNQKNTVFTAPAVLCTGLSNEIQCWIGIMQKYLAQGTKTNQQPSLKQVCMEVRLVTAMSREFFSLARILQKKKKTWHPGYINT